jgi:membrane protease YdiL (CAAX protease family)
MKNKLEIIKSDNIFAERVKQYTAEDSILALLLFIIFIIIYSVLAAIEAKLRLSNDNVMIMGFIVNVILVLVTTLFLKAKKQGINSIGLTGGKWKVSCLTGVILAGILFFMNCGQYLLQGNALVDGRRVIVLMVYYLSVSLCEEVVFRGYIGTRLNGIVKNQWISIILTGLLFVIMHFPYRMIAYGIPLQELTYGSLSWIADLFITHTILSIIYAKTNSLYGAILPHWMSNLAYAIVDR